MPSPHPPPRLTTAARTGMAPLLLAALVFVLALLGTLAAARSAHQAAQAELANVFDYRARDVAASLRRRIAVYEQVLRGEQGFLRGAVSLTRREFAGYYQRLHLEQHFPGFEALGIASVIAPDARAAHERAVRAEGYPGYAVHPPGTRTPLTAITHIEPFRGRNLRAFGFDMYSEPVRRAAMDAARDSGVAAATGRVVLVQDGGASEQSGFLMYLPVYRAGQPTDSVTERRAALIGWVYAPFRLNDLMRDVGGAHAADLALRIDDGTAPADATLLYRSANTDNAHRPLLSTRITLPVAGRTWTLSVASTPAFEAQRQRGQAWMIGVAGAGLGFLLSLIVWLQASERRRALALARDMTVELRASHARLEEEQTRMRTILRHAYDAFIAVDADARVTDWSPQAELLFGWSEQEALGRDIAELVVPPDQRAQHRAGFARYVANGTGPLLAGPREMTAMHKSGRALPVELAIAALPTASGIGASAFVRDIAPRKAAEARERQRQLRLDETRAALQRAQKLEAVGKLTGGVAHDFNNLLHIISANVQLMLRADEANRKRLHSILEAVERGAKLSSQLLAFARRQPLHPSVVDIGQLLERMDSLLQRAAGEAVQLQRQVPHDLWPTLVDPNQLENVILNLVINARDAMAGRGQVHITLANLAVAADYLPDPELAPGQYVLLTVADTGAGMPPEVMERAFEPFFTTKPEGKGTGLGLSMAHGFVKQSGGHIRLASAPGQGTTVSIYLPRCTSQVTQTAEATAA